jgi:hypothetical protein
MCLVPLLCSRFTNSRNYVHSGRGQYLPPLKPLHINRVKQATAATDVMKLKPRRFAVTRLPVVGSVRLSHGFQFSLGMIQTLAELQLIALLWPAWWLVCFFCLSQRTVQALFL